MVRVSAEKSSAAPFQTSKKTRGVRIGLNSSFISFGQRSTPGRRVRKGLRPGGRVGCSLSLSSPGGGVRRPGWSPVVWCVRAVVAVRTQSRAGGQNDTTCFGSRRGECTK